MAMGPKAEVLHCLSGILRSTEEKGVRSSRCPQGELVQSQRLTASLLDSGPSSSGKTKSSDGQFRDRKKAVVIRNRTDDDNGFALLRLSDVRGNTRQGNGRAIDSRHKEAPENDFVEIGLRAAWQISH